MRDMYAVLKDKLVVPVSNVMDWATDFETTIKRVGDDSVGDVRVSTVFLGVNHSYGYGPPLWFETMIFGGEYDQHQWRYETWFEAETGHKEILKTVRRSNG